MLLQMTLGFHWMSWLIYFSGILTGSRAGNDCQFPDYMQSNPDNGPKRDWRTHVVEGRHHGSHLNWELALGFYGDSMRSSVIGGINAEDRPHPYTRQCRIEVGNGRYLVSHKEHGSGKSTDTAMFLCIEFLKRSDDVVQLLQSRMIEYSDYRACADKHMDLNPWILINQANFSRSKTKCPLSGGFNMKIYDKVGGKEVCTGYDGATRIESECMAGEGMIFQYRMDNCVPDKLHMHREQRVYCMADWQQDGFTYSIIRTGNKSEHAWCMKYPTENNGAFLSYLFRDLRCESDSNPKDTDRYLRMVLIRDKPRSLTDLCMDDYEACNYWKAPCIHAGSFMQLTCSKKCGICDPDRPNACTLPSSLRGTWSEQHATGVNRLEINDIELSVDGYSKFRCIQWYPRPYEHDVRNYEQMFVTTFDNGCRPRYTCAQFKKHSPSILKYKISQSETWPFEGTTGVTVNCNPFRYKEDDEPFGSRYHSRHLKVLITGVDERIYVNCQLPYDVMTFSVMFRNGSECQGVLKQDPQKRLQVLTDGACLGIPMRQSFGCLDSSKHGYISDRIIVTEVLDGGSSSLLCWMFPISPRDAFYLLPADECNEGAKERISSGIMQPLATFTYHAPSTTTSSTAAPQILVEVNGGPMLQTGNSRTGPSGEGAYKLENYEPHQQGSGPSERGARVVNTGDDDPASGGAYGSGGASGFSPLLSASSLLLLLLLHTLLRPQALSTMNIM